MKLKQLEDDMKYINVCIDDYVANMDHNADFDSTEDTLKFITETPELSTRSLKLSQHVAVSLINEAIKMGWSAKFVDEDDFEVIISIEESN